MAASQISFKAHVCEAYGDYRALVVREMPPPSLGPSDVLVRNRAFPVGFPDLLTVQGKYQRKPPLPFVPGSEFSGVVAAVGEDVSQFSCGDEVIGNVLLGAYAEHVVAPETSCFALPAAFDFIRGAAFQTAYRTAYVGLVERGQLRQGESLLVLGASGGVGLAAVELGRELGASVIAAASSEEKLALARSFGAHHVINYADLNFRDAVKEITSGRGADVIYDPVGGDYFDEALHCIAPFGRMLVIGFASGRISEAPVNYPLIKQMSIVGVRAGEFGRLDPMGGKRVNEALLELANQEKIHPHIHACYAFDRVVEALDVLSSRSVTGRIVVEIDA